LRETFQKRCPFTLGVERKNPNGELGDLGVKFAPVATLLKKVFFSVI
jgi:hypothetical protein